MPLSHRAASRVFIWLTLLTLSGCQLLEPRHEPGANQLADARNQQQLSELRHWRLQGKISIAQGSRREHAAISYWIQQGDTFEANLTSPLLGLAATTLVGNPDSLRIETAGEPARESRQPSLLVQQVLGWPLPLSAIPFWIKGSPAPESPHRWRDIPESGAIQLEQQDWIIRYDRIAPLALTDGDSNRSQPVQLPHRVVLQRTDVEIKVIITEWEAQTP